MTILKKFINSFAYSFFFHSEDRFVIIPPRLPSSIRVLPRHLFSPPPAGCLRRLSFFKQETLLTVAPSLFAPVFLFFSVGRHRMQSVGPLFAKSSGILSVENAGVFHHASPGFFERIGPLGLSSFLYLLTGAVFPNLTARTVFSATPFSALYSFLCSSLECHRGSFPVSSVASSPKL